MYNSFKLILLGLLLIPILTQASSNINLSRKCENAFIGHGYNQSLENPCRIYWQRWTAEIKNETPTSH